MRLGTEVQARAYALALTVDPAQPRHSGSVDIDVQLALPTTRIRLHAKDLQVQQAWAEVGPRKLVWPRCGRWMATASRCTGPGRCRPARRG